MHKSLGGIALLLCGAWVASAAVATDSTHGAVPRSVIEQVIDAYGGRSALEQVKAYRADGKVVTRQQGREGPMSRLFQRPGRLRVELRYPDLIETRIVDGSRGWRGLGTEFAPSKGMMLDAMVLQAMRSDLPLFLLSHQDSVRAIAPLMRDSLQLEGLEVALGAGRSLRAYIDPATHRILVSQSLLGEGEAAMKFETNYSDFRSVGSVLFAFHEVNFAAGTATGTTTIDSLTLNPKFGPAGFDAPR